MKEYVKPTIELIELKVEERISASGYTGVCDKSNNGPQGCKVSNNGINNQWKSKFGYF